VNLVDEQAARDAEVVCALQLRGRDGADVFEPQPVITGDTSLTICAVDIS
jgi:hypothetical protein